MARERSLLVLPFEDSYVALFEQLRSASLKIEGIQYEQGRMTLSPERIADFGRSESVVEVELDLEELGAAAKECDLIPSDIRFAVMTFSRLLNLSCVGASKLLSDLDSGSLLLPVPRPSDDAEDPLRARHSGFGILVLMTLDREMANKRKLLVPWRRHTILARAEFNFSSNDEGPGLRIEKLTEEVRDANRLPLTCLSFVSLTESPLESSNLKDNCTLYVDEKIGEKIKYAPNSPASRALQRTVGLDLLSDLVMKAHGELSHPDKSETQWTEVSDTVVGKVVKNILSRAQPRTGPRMSEEDLFNELKQDPYRSISRMQSFLGVRNEVLRTFDGEEDTE
jgi:hypothetical protein